MYDIHVYWLYCADGAVYTILITTTHNSLNRKITHLIT